MRERVVASQGNMVSWTRLAHSCYRGFLAEIRLQISQRDCMGPVPAPQTPAVRPKGFVLSSSDGWHRAV